MTNVEAVISRRKNGKLVREALELLLNNVLPPDSPIYQDIALSSEFSDATALLGDGLDYMSQYPYEALSISYAASIDDLKSSYKKLALKYHPDRNPKTNDIFVVIKAAYDNLSEKINSKTPSIPVGPQQQPNRPTAQSFSQPTPPQKSNRPVSQSFSSDSSAPKDQASAKVKPTNQPNNADSLPGIFFDIHRRQRAESQQARRNTSSSSSSSAAAAHEAAMLANFEKTNISKEYHDGLVREASIKAFTRIQQKLGTDSAIAAMFKASFDTNKSSRFSAYVPQYHPSSVPQPSQPAPLKTPDFSSYYPQFFSSSPPSGSREHSSTSADALKPESFTASPIDSTAVELTWQRPSAIASLASASGLFTYSIEINWRVKSNNPNEPWGAPNKLVSGDKCRKRNLIAGQVYEFRIRAAMDLNNGLTDADSRCLNSGWTDIVVVEMFKDEAIPSTEKQRKQSRRRSSTKTSSRDESPSHTLPPVNKSDMRRASTYTNAPSISETPPLSPMKSFTDQSSYRDEGFLSDSLESLNVSVDMSASQASDRAPSKGGWMRDSKATISNMQTNENKESLGDVTAEDVEDGDTWRMLIPPVSLIESPTNYLHPVRVEPISTAKIVGYVTPCLLVQIRAECGPWAKVKVHQCEGGIKWGWCVSEENRDGLRHHYFREADHSSSAISPTNSVCDVSVWEVRYDECSGAVYYYCPATNDSRWEAPEWIQEFDTRSNTWYYVQLDVNTGHPITSTWDKPSTTPVRLIRESIQLPTVL